MNCLICHKPVVDLGKTLPKSVHLRCMSGLPAMTEAVERALFQASIPRGKTIQFRKFAPLKTATPPL